MKRKINILLINNPNTLREKLDYRRTRVGNALSQKYNITYHEMDGDDFMSSHDFPRADLIVISGKYIHDNFDWEQALAFRRIIEYTYASAGIVVDSNQDSWVKLARKMGIYSSLDLESAKDDTAGEHFLNALDPNSSLGKLKDIVTQKEFEKYVTQKNPPKKEIKSSKMIMSIVKITLAVFFISIITLRLMCLFKNI